MSYEPGQKAHSALPIPKLHGVKRRRLVHSSSENLPHAAYAFQPSLGLSDHTLLRLAPERPTSTKVLHNGWLHHVAISSLTKDYKADFSPVTKALRLPGI